jgi:choline/glycine/proline betaine transport protein
LITRARTLVRDNVHPVVFGASALVTIAFVLFTVLFTDTAAGLFPTLQAWFTDTFGWFLVLAVAGFLVLSLWLALGPYGRIRLGPDGSTPDYSTLSWFAMLFSAGMGIGLLYWGVAEPISYFATDPPIGEPGSVGAAEDAMIYTFHHWGFSPWAIYAVIGLGLAYFGYRRDQPLAIRSLFRPLLGDRVDGPLGNLVDVLAAVGTMFGVATSLGLGVMQVNAGLNHVFGTTISTNVQLLLVAGITALATVSVVLGLDRGIQRLSQLNVTLAALTLGFVLAVGPTLLLLSAFVENTGTYLGSMLEVMFRAGAYEGQEWLSNWTLFYWAWWVSWSPFVGMFIARISRGRTIREFVLGVLLVPSLVSFLWFTVLGNTAISLEQAGAGLADLVAEDESLALFGLLEQLPFSTITAVVVTILVVSFFVTSSDSGSFVIDMLTSGGDPDPHVATRVFWAVSEGAVAAALLLAGGLAALQAAAISTGLPFTAVLVAAAWSLAKGLREEVGPRPRRQAGLPPVHILEATRREREARQREFELRERELQNRERELDVRERELEATTARTSQVPSPPDHR